MRRVNRLGFTALAAAALMAGCSDDKNTPSGPTATAQVRVVHGSPDAPMVNVQVDNQGVLSDVSYLDFSGYLPVPAGSRNIKVIPVGSTTAVIDATAPVVADGFYTVIATNVVASIEPLILADDLTPPAAGNIKLRLVHGAPNVGPVDIYITAPNTDITSVVPSLTGVSFKQNSGYLEVPAGNYQVQITPTTTKTVAIDTGALTLAAGQIRTAIAVETAPGVSPYSALLLPDLN